MLAFLRKYKSLLEFKFSSHVVFLLAAGMVVFVIKFVTVYPIQYIGYADAAGYAEMADSLVHGRGFEVDYISWYFKKYDPEVSRPEDHWPPLYPITIAPFFLIFGKTAFAAKLPSLIISCFFLPMVVYLITKELTGKKLPGVGAGLSVLLYPTIFQESLWCLSDVLYAFVVCAGVLFSMKAVDDERYFYPLGIFLGLAYYAKGSGLVLIPCHILFHFIARRSIKKVLINRKFLISLLIIFLILLPWFVRNYIHFGDPIFSTQKYVSGYIGYEDWEAGAYELYWGEKPVPSVFDKFRETLLFSIGQEFKEDLDNSRISRELWYEFRKNDTPLSRYVVLSTEDAGSEWRIKDELAYPIGNKVIYTIRKEEDRLNVYKGGVYNALRTTTHYLARHFWLIFLDINTGRFIMPDAEDRSKWVRREESPRDAFLTYLLNMPALLGLVFLWGNKKRHVFWIIVGSLTLFMSIVWSPIYRLVLPMTSLMIALSWATYFAIPKIIVRMLNGLFRRLKRGGEQEVGVSGMSNVDPEPEGQGDISSTSELIPPEKRRLKCAMVSDILICCLAVITIIVSAENISRAYKRGGYPYHDAAWDCMDAAKWLRENASPDSITMAEFPWDLHFYSEQRAIQIPRVSLEKTIEVMRFYKPEYLLLIIQRIRSTPSLVPLITGEVPGLELVHDNSEMKLYKIHYDLLPQ